MLDEAGICLTVPNANQIIYRSMYLTSILNTLSYWICVSVIFCYVKACTKRKLNCTDMNCFSGVQLITVVLLVSLSVFLPNIGLVFGPTVSSDVFVYMFLLGFSVDKAPFCQRPATLPPASSSVLCWRSADGATLRHRHHQLHEKLVYGRMSSILICFVISKPRFGN